jgi:hypothetical protein
MQLIQSMKMSKTAQSVKERCADTDAEKNEAGHASVEAIAMDIRALDDILIFVFAARKTDEERRIRHTEK